MEARHAVRNAPVTSGLEKCRSRQRTHSRTRKMRTSVAATVARPARGECSCRRPQHCTGGVCAPRLAVFSELPGGSMFEREKRANLHPQLVEIGIARACFALGDQLTKQSCRSRSFFFSLSLFVLCHLSHISLSVIVPVCLSNDCSPLVVVLAETLNVL